jgi:hypothetical protein
MGINWDAVQAIGSIGAIVGSFWVVNHQHNKQVKHERKKVVERINGMLDALSTEVDICSMQAGVYIGTVSKKVHYRLPLMAYRHILPKLLTAGTLRKEWMMGLTLFFTDATSFNFSLDKLDEMWMPQYEDLPPQHWPTNVQRAWKMVQVKAMHLISQTDPIRVGQTDPDLLNAASRVEGAHMAIEAAKRELKAG